ncbi:MAG: response regulator [Caldiserica bacterium]|nr:MAG: response regulator [Caldisericota bacterium]
MKKSRILVVDDDRDTREILEARLKACGYDVITASDGFNALEIIRERKPDLILLDVMMPEIDGFTVCKFLKEREETKDIPIIFLTAKESLSDVDKGFKSGGDDYVLKPINWERLLPKIKKFLP